MKKSMLFLLAVLIAATGFTAPAPGQKLPKDALRVCTYNIRGNLGRDGQNEWPYRKDSLCKIILRHDFDIVCVQEAHANQLADIAELTGYGFVGIRGLFNPVFYKADRFELLHTETFWLSETMEPFSKGWDGKYDRYCTWAQFRDRKSGKEFFVFNAHLDHRGVVARPEAAKLVCAQAKKYAGDAPVFVCGDMNSLDTTEAYAAYTAHYKDSKAISPRVSGPEGTAHNFGKVEPIRIDYIFINDRIRILNYAVEDEQYPGGLYPSDHYAVYVHAVLEK